MARKGTGRGRGILIALGVIVAIVIVAVVSVRVLLTREKLLAIVIPRVEKMVNAKVAIKDIGVSFPFGLGVNIDGLSFEKTLPDTSSLAFTSDKVTVRSSLMSLIRRKPEIKAADVTKGSLTLVKERTRRETKLLGLGAHLTLKPSPEGSAVSVKALADSVLLSLVGSPPAIALRKVGIDGELSADPAFTTLTVKDARVSWEDLLKARVTGQVTNLKTAPRMDLTIESSDAALAPIYERVKTFRLDELAPAGARAARSAAPKTPVALSGGTLGLKAHLTGLVKEIPAMNLAFECRVKDLGVKAGELASIPKIGAELKGEGVVLAWQSLFPSPEKRVSPAQLRMAWQAIKLDGAVEVEGGDLVVGGPAAGAAPAEASAVDPPGAAAAADPPGRSAPPIRLTGLKAKAEISGMDVKKVSGGFAIGGSPYTFDASMLGALPAAAEIALVARTIQASGEKPPSLGTLLDRMVNAPVVKLQAKGRSFDARPYQKPAGGAQEGVTGAAAPGAAAAAPAAQPAGGGAGAVLFLKNTTFDAKIDSIVAREAVITDVEAAGSIRDGRMRIEPLSYAFAGGKGKATVTSDVRDLARIDTKVDLSMDGVEASQALARFGAVASFIQGTFSFSSIADVVTGKGLNPLMTLTANGLGRSTKGEVSFDSFLAPLSKIQGFDVTPFRKFDFSDWTGNYTVKNGRVETSDWKISSSRGNWLIRGSFGFDGTLDYAVRVSIPPEVQRMMSGLDRYKSAFDLMRDASGNLVLDIKVSGTAKRPSASLDLTQANKNVQNKLIEDLKKRFLH